MCSLPHQGRTQLHTPRCPQGHTGRGSAKCCNTDQQQLLRSSAPTLTRRFPLSAGFHTPCFHLPSGAPAVCVQPKVQSPISGQSASERAAEDPLSPVVVMSPDPPPTGALGHPQLNTSSENTYSNPTTWIQETQTCPTVPHAETSPDPGTQAPALCTLAAL